MLSTLLNNLASYFSKYFVIASFLPMLVFTFLNGVMAYLLWEPFHDWVDTDLFVQPNATRTVFLITSLVTGILAAAYVLSGMSGFLRRVLEGHWPSQLSNGFIGLQERRLQSLEDHMEEAVKTRLEVEESAPGWIRRLIEARRKGVVGNANTFAESAPVVKQLQTLKRRRAQRQLIPHDDLEEAVDDLETHLETHSADVKAGPTGSLLAECHKDLAQLIRFSVEHANAEHVRLLNEIHSNFGSNLAPTRMGNIANTVQSYAVRRYGCNLEIAWSRLRRLAGKDEATAAAIQESKSQLDFLIACCWLTLAWSLIWAVVLGFSPYWGWFLLVAYFGPLIAYLWYRAATEQYRAFGEVLTSTLDAFRFDLIQDLHLALPPDIEGEKLLWDTVNRWASYGEDVNLRYRHPGSEES